MRGVYVLVCVLIVGLALPTGVCAHSVPHGWLGVTAGQLNSSPDVPGEMLRMRAAGVESLRLPVYWRELQPDGPRSVRFDALDQTVRAAAAARIRILAVVLAAPAWATDRSHPLFGTPPARASAYGRLLTRLVSRYGPSGTLWSEHPELPYVPIRAWEVWNEPNIPYFWTDQPFAQRYVALLRVAHRAIKRADRHATVLAAGFPATRRDWPIIRQLYAAGARGLFDALSIHPYTLEVRNVLRLVEIARAQLRRVHDGRRPLWATEITWPASKGVLPSHFAFAVTPQQQARNLNRILPLLAANRQRLGLQRVFWEAWLTGYRSRTTVFDYCGLRSPDGDEPLLGVFARAADALERR